MEMHGFTMENLCTFGDADNDYDMTLHAGVGVVMANGSRKTKVLQIILPKTMITMELSVSARTFDLQIIRICGLKYKENLYQIKRKTYNRNNAKDVDNKDMWLYNLKHRKPSRK